MCTLAATAGGMALFSRSAGAPCARIDLMDLDLTRELSAVPDLRHQVRQLRWFKQSFRREAELVGAHHEVAIAIDDKRLTQAFLAWIEAFNREKAHAASDRRDFTFFAAGLLLRELMRARPASVGPRGAAARADAPDETIVDFWPEGFLYTSYCLSVLSAVVEQEFGEPLSLAEGAGDLRVWWSYRENVAEDPSRAIAFLDAFVGIEPNWLMPASAESRAAMGRAARELLAP